MGGGESVVNEEKGVNVMSKAEIDFSMLDKLVEDFKADAQNAINMQYDDFETVRMKMDTISQNIVKQQDLLKDTFDDIYQKAEADYGVFTSKMSGVIKKLDQLSIYYRERLKVEYLPYNFKELLDIAERIGHLSDQQFERLVELARAFSNSGRE